MNPLYTAMMQNTAAGGAASILQHFAQFRNMFRGDARQQVQALMNSGKISQAQYNNAVQMAQQLQGLLK